MHKLTNFAGGVRHGWDSMPFGANRQHPPPQQQQHPSHEHLPRTNAANPYQRRPAPQQGQQQAHQQLPPPQLPLLHATPLSWCFTVPFNNTLAGPEPSHIVYASKGARERWTHPPGLPETPPVHRLPVHQEHVEAVRAICSRIREETGVEAHVAVGRAASLAPVPGIQPTPSNNVVANVCVHGRDYEVVMRAREEVLNNSPITMQCATVPVDRSMVIKDENATVNPSILSWLDEIANLTKADIFLIDPAERHDDGGIVANSKEQLKFVIYGDMLTKENAKIRILIMIDQMLLNMVVDSMQMELALHTLLCGRSRKKIKAIESSTDTAIYFPPTFPGIHLYAPEGAERRPPDEIVITGPSEQRIFLAKTQLQELSNGANTYVKDVRITPTKIDHLVLQRLDKIQSIMEAHGSFLLLPAIGQQVSLIRVQGLDVLNVERTIRDVMGLATQFYSAEWQFAPIGRMPSESQVQSMLSDICASSGAEVIFCNTTFYVFGSDEACRTALEVISHIPFVNQSKPTIHIKLELASEHKEFVSGKKNGKINKIMNSSNIQIVFDGFNDYNFYIDVRGSDFSTTMYGLSLVEAELPASLSFHVPDQYHKRIIGIGGQHIQQLMKKYSVFVKFSNAHDRGPVVGKEDDSVKLDNVICRTPSRNAQNLELVKQEIMDMVNRPDAEQVTEQVTIDRLRHRELLSSRMHDIEKLEKTWNCKITFPSTEQASDVVQVSGPEFQVPNAIYGLLAMVPESHEISFTATDDVKGYLSSTEFSTEVVEKMQSQHLVNVSHPNSPADQPNAEFLVLNYTRNDAGGLKDAIDFLISTLVVKGLDAATVKGLIPRPKSDSFEDSLPYFESKLIHRPSGTDSPTRPQFSNGSEAEAVGGTPSAGFFSKFRKPGSMSSFTSFMERRSKNNNGTGAGTHSPASSFFKHASSNASKASLASLESQGSGYRNFWNDSAINLAEEEAMAASAAAAAAAAHGHHLPWQTHQKAPHLGGGPGFLMGAPTSGGPLSASMSAPHLLITSSAASKTPPGLGGLGATHSLSAPGDATTPTAATTTTTTTTMRFDARAPGEGAVRPGTSNSISGYPGLLAGRHR